MCQFKHNEPLDFTIGTGGCREVPTLDKSVANLPGLKLFEAQAGTAAEYDKAAAEKHKAEVDQRMKTLADEAGTGWWMALKLQALAHDVLQ